jgi:ribosomal protein L40E
MVFLAILVAYSVNYVIIAKLDHVFPLLPYMIVIGLGFVVTYILSFILQFVARMNTSPIALWQPRDLATSSVSDQKTCAGCGTHLARNAEKCPKCGMGTESDEIYPCRSCGANLRAAATFFRGAGMTVYTGGSSAMPGGMSSIIIPVNLGGKLLQRPCTNCGEQKPYPASMPKSEFEKSFRLRWVIFVSLLPPASVFAVIGIARYLFSGSKVYGRLRPATVVAMVVSLFWPTMFVLWMAGGFH